MRASEEDFYEELERNPEDWSVRLRLIRSAIEAGEVEEAKKLVRESPDEGPLPGELQQQIHQLLVAGARDASNPHRNLPTADD
ncbi:MAG: tetratricopeptide repeat protein [Verrucomicrobiales bacterium]|nr:tetratricopeptide repeat protein [Verrucomicrobiales bacterium]